MRVNQSLIERAASEKPFLYLLLTKDGRRISGSIEQSPVEGFHGEPAAGPASRSPTPTPRAGRSSTRPAACRNSSSGGEILFVGADAGEDEAYVAKIVRRPAGGGPAGGDPGPGGRACWSAATSRAAWSSLIDVVERVRNGDDGRPRPCPRRPRRVRRTGPGRQRHAGPAGAVHGRPQARRRRHRPRPALAADPSARPPGGGLYRRGGRQGQRRGGPGPGAGGHRRGAEDLRRGALHRPPAGRGPGAQPGHLRSCRAGRRHRRTLRAASARRRTWNTPPRWPAT